MSISAGEVTGIVGPDGAGKTTLIRLLAGLMLPTAGEVIVCGDDTRTQTEHLRHLVSYMPQRFGLYEDLTVAENLLLYADLRGVVGAGARRRPSPAAVFTGLAPFTDAAGRQTLRRHEAKAGPGLRVDPQAAAAVAGRAERRRRSDLAPRAVANGLRAGRRRHRRGLEHRLSGRSRALRAPCCCSTKASSSISDRPKN